VLRSPCLALPLLLSPLAAGQAQAPTGPGFVLSRTPDLTRDERGFSQADTLHMWVRAPAVREDLGAPSPEPLTGWWRLEGPTQVFSGPLEARASGMTAAFPLAAADEPAVVWTWSAVVEWKGQVVATPLAALRIELLAPRADFVLDRSEGEAPLSVAFQDTSSGAITSWSWDFDDGTSSSERHPTHVFRAPGAHTITLRVVGPFGSDVRVLDGLVSVHEQDLVLHYGMNASVNAWWQRGIAFADAMARASEFNRVIDGAITREPAPLIPLGESPARLGAGWPDVTALGPGEKAGARLFGSMAGTMPDGRLEPYVLTWEGTGTCRLAGPPVVGERNRSAQRVEFLVDPSAGTGDGLLIWVLDASDPADPVRNAHVWLPGMEAEKPVLWPPFVAKLQALNGGRGPTTWRGMDWTEVNQYGRLGGSAPFVFDLAGVITPASPSQGTKRGVCPEFQVALCNAVGADLQLNVPHQTDALSDEDYATFLRDTFRRVRDGSPAVPGVNGGRPFAPLDPRRTLTVEFSNEIWNAGFPVNAWLKARAAANGRTLYQEAAEQIRRVFAVADEVFAGEHAPRLRKYVGGWMGDPRFLLEVLAALGPVHVDAVGPAFYFGPRKADIDSWLLDADPDSCPNCPFAEEVLNSARKRIGELDLKLLEHQLIAQSHRNPDGSTPRLVLYEAGASFYAGFQPWGPAASQAQRLPGMYDAYVQDLVPALVTRGVATVLWYSFMTDGGQGSAGPFGHWERMDQEITLPVPDVYLDEGAPRASAIYRLPPRNP